MENNKLKTGSYIDHSVTNEIELELFTAEIKHTWEDKPLANQALIMLEEAGEVARAVNLYQEEGGSVEDIRTELIQTAAMCYRMLKNLPK